MKIAMQSVGASNFPIYITEVGYTIADPKQASDHARNAVLLAALGCRAYIAYNYDDHVNFAVDGIKAEWNAVADLLCGSIISRVSYTPSQVFATISGVDYTFG